jgi:hypothetical protein
MPKIAIALAPLGLISILIVGAVTPASADSFSCSNQRIHSDAACGGPESPQTQEFAAQSRRPRVTIYRRRVYPRPNAVRQCRSWLVREYRVSGPVIVPQMYCWWE